jgi:hypothetical protein
VGGGQYALHVMLESALQCLVSGSASELALGNKDVLKRQGCRGSGEAKVGPVHVRTAIATPSSRG